MKKIRLVLLITLLVSCSSERSNTNVHMTPSNSEVHLVFEQEATNIEEQYTNEIDEIENRSYESDNDVIEELNGQKMEESDQLTKTDSNSRKNDFIEHETSATNDKPDQNQEDNTNMNTITETERTKDYFLSDYYIDGAKWQNILPNEEMLDKLLANSLEILWNIEFGVQEEILVVDGIIYNQYNEFLDTKEKFIGYTTRFIDEARISLWLDLAIQTGEIIVIDNILYKRHQNEPFVFTDFEYSIQEIQNIKQISLPVNMFNAQDQDLIQTVHRVVVELDTNMDFYNALTFKYNFEKGWVCFPIDFNYRFFGTNLFEVDSNADVPELSIEEGVTKVLEAIEIAYKIELIDHENVDYIYNGWGYIEFSFFEDRRITYLELIEEMKEHMVSNDIVGFANYLITSDSILWNNNLYISPSAFSIEGVSSMVGCDSIEQNGNVAILNYYVESIDDCGDDNQRLHLSKWHLYYDGQWKTTWYRWYGFID